VHQVEDPVVLPEMAGELLRDRDGDGYAEGDQQRPPEVDEERREQGRPSAKKTDIRRRRRCPNMSALPTP